MITVLCSTYGRPRRLEEMLASFLRQNLSDSPHSAHLIILNDCPWQRLTFCHPRVTVVNHDQRFPSFGEKRQFLLEQSPDGLVTYWDDDDIYLPEYLIYSQRNLANHRTMCAKHQRLWIDGGHRLYRIGAAAWMNTALADRSILLGCGGFDPVHNGSCVGITRRLVKAGHFHGPAEWDGTPPTFIYRQNDGHHHVSAEEPESAYASMFRNADQECGDIQLLPHWKEDYAAKAAKSWESVSAVLA